PLFCDAYKRNAATGSLILIDLVTNETAGAGMITGIQADSAQPSGTGTQAKRSAHRRHQAAIVWVDSNHHLQSELERALLQRGCVVHAIQEAVAPEHAAQLIRILSAAGVISIWSPLALARADLEKAVQAAGNLAFIAANYAAEVASVCDLLEDRGILF